MALKDFLFPDEEIRYQTKETIEYSDNEKYILYITNRRIIGFKKTGLFRNKDRLFSVGLEEVRNILYKEEGLITKKGKLEVKTLTTPYTFKGKPEVKVVCREMQKFLTYTEGKGSPSAYQ
ncbi:MAG: hypothetical protein HMLIMOIP_000155 [Candidatus Nitrosomirales archaeon]|jgi:hypothetical protein